MPIATRMFLFPEDTRRFLARLENQTNSNPSSGKDLQFESTKKRQEYCLYSSDATDSSCTHLPVEECSFHSINKKNYKQEPHKCKHFSIKLTTL